MQILVIVVGLALVGLVVLIALQMWKQSDAGRTALVRKARASLPVSSIANAQGTCRIAGRVRVLEPVPDYPKHGAFFTRSVSSTFRQVRNRKTGTVRQEPVTNVTELNRVGRFAVIDDSGVAVVEDPEAMVWFGDTAHLGPKQSGSIDVKDDTAVEVLGVAELGPLPQGLAAHGEYRGKGTAVFMRAPEAKKLLIVVQG